ncbi:MAG: DUF1244 domain-containing protein [Methylococcales bacterium]|jgi:hypothetical protein|nr:DUF1244 domain-containing protein [Methylococcales bacterium]MBT3699496.1 DUF1244 domain-containing protein [Methylococcales bacterium]MBT4348563.1 DUF1244 domain-containing protein [Methylococcales bacterium]MBT4600248.1 DUF1244 domain-containing protein [Methylococcales bacterium]MBT4664387.1 DUF1244 domain-containing protein [Methylococcales bacterium]
MSDPDQQVELEAAVLKRLLHHLQTHPDVQNIELMNLADFCRNCLAKWYLAAAEEKNITLDYDQAREFVYGMPYREWKEKHQQEATPEQLALFELKRSQKKHR